MSAAETPDKPPEAAPETPADEALDAEEALDEDASLPSAIDKLMVKLEPVLRHIKLIIAGIVFAVMAVIMIWLYVSTGYFSQAQKAFTASPSASLELPEASVFQDLQNMVVDLKPTRKRKRPFIRFTLTVEFVGEANRALLLERETKIRDAIQVHLRTVTVEEISGEVGTNKLRAEMVDLINDVMEPERIITVLFKDILVR